jgi:hypothetical protein
MRNSPLPGVQTLVRTLMTSQGADGTVEKSLATVETVLQTLGDRIAPLIGREGFHMLLQRALKRASDAHPHLHSVRVQRDAGSCLAGTAELGRDASPKEATAAVEAIIGEVVSLLARFVGADLTIQLVRQAFPELSGRKAKPSTENTEDE